MHIFRLRCMLLSCGVIATIDESNKPNKKSQWRTHTAFLPGRYGGRGSDRDDGMGAHKIS